jgi:3-phosphoglycerate kinase/nucleotide-binding universal stress UspA family protein
MRSIRTVPAEELRGKRVLVRIDPDDALQLRESSATFALLSAAGASVIVIASERAQGISASDIYCNEAFSLSHEARASTIEAARKARLAVAGLAFEREFNQLEAVLRDPQRPVVTVLGGELSRDKLLLVEEIARRSDRTLLGGELCFPFMQSRGIAYDTPLVTDEMLRIAERILTEADNDKRFIITPADFTVADEATFRRLTRGEPFVFEPPVRNVGEDQLRRGDIICDIGPITQWSWSDTFRLSRLLFWHAPLGIFEIQLFSKGTQFLAEELTGYTDKTHQAILCGSGLVAAVEGTGFSGKINQHVTSAGRAALHYFAGRPLPAVQVLEMRDKARARPCRILIPLEGKDSDIGIVKTAARMATHDARIFLLHVRAGFDEERHPDLAAAMTQAQRYQRRVESERIFARANAVLASHSLVSAGQSTGQGKPADVILRHAKRIRAEVIVLTTGVQRIMKYGVRAALVA